MAGSTATGQSTATGPEAEWAEAAAALLTAIGAVRRAVRRSARQAWAAEPLPQPHSELLRLAARRPGLSVAQAAGELLLAPNTVSTLVGGLASQGLIDRGRSASDGRCLRLQVTAAGHQRLAEWRDLRAELAGRALAGLAGTDRRALAASVPALLRLAAGMEAE
jgi:DNA-binding MarR family transcriptional regulator